MAEQPEPDRAHELAALQAEAMLASLQAAGEAPRPGAALRSGSGWTVLVSVFPTPAPLVAGLPALTACDLNCLNLLAQLSEPLSASAIRRELERRSVGVYAGITVKRSLARLHTQLHLIANSRKRPRGYWLPEKLPLLLRVPDTDRKDTG